MKKYLVLIVSIMFNIQAFAQKGDVVVGVNTSYGTEIKNVGFGVKAQYHFTDALRAEVSGDYFLKKDGLSLWDINLNFHYLFPLGDKIKIYPLAGVTFTNWKYDYSGFLDGVEESMKYLFDDLDSENATRFGANLGGGIQYDITNNFIINAEAKYQLISDLDQAVFTIGLAYKF
jgi:outer membrane protein X